MTRRALVQGLFPFISDRVARGKAVALLCSFTCSHNIIVGHNNPAPRRDSLSRSPRWLEGRKFSFSSGTLQCPASTHPPDLPGAHGSVLGNPLVMALGLSPSGCAWQQVEAVCQLHCWCHQSSSPLVGTHFLELSLRRTSAAVLGPVLGPAGRKPLSDIPGAGLGTWVSSAPNQIKVRPTQEAPSVRRKAGLASHSRAGPGAAQVILLWDQNSAMPSVQRNHRITES